MSVRTMRKIQELRISNSDVARVTVTRLATNGTPFEVASNDQIVGELRIQMDVLMNELAMFKIQRIDSTQKNRPSYIFCG